MLSHATQAKTLDLPSRWWRSRSGRLRAASRHPKIWGFSQSIFSWPPAGRSKTASAGTLAAPYFVVYLLITLDHGLEAMALARFFNGPLTEPPPQCRICCELHEYFGQLCGIARWS